jgi:cytochrome b561
MIIPRKLPTMALFPRYSAEGRAVPIQGVMTIVIIFVGACGLLHDTGTAPAGESWLNMSAAFGMPAAFGLLLCASIIARFCWAMSRPALVPPTDIKAFTRHQSRMVYLMLYCLMGIKEGGAVATSLWHGQAPDFGWLQGNPGATIDHAMYAPVEGFRVYLAYGVFALILIRILAAGWHHSRDSDCGTSQ